MDPFSEPSSLGVLLGLSSEAEFLSNVLGRSYYQAKGTGETFVKLFSWNDVNSLITYSSLSFPQLCLRKGGEILPQNLYFSNESTGSIPRLRLVEVNTLLRTGATMFVDQLDYLDERVAATCRAVEQRLRLPVSSLLAVNCVPDEHASATSNEHDILVLQSAGSLKVIIHGGPQPGGQPAESMSNPPRWAGSVEPGDVLYIPAHWRYTFEHAGDPSIQLILRFRSPAGIDLARYALERLRPDSAMKRPYPHLDSPERQADHFTSLKRTVQDAVDRPGFLLGLLEDIQLMSEPRSRLGLPWSALPRLVLQAVKGHRIILLIRFPNAEGVITHVEEANAIEICHDRRSIRFSEATLELFRYLIVQQAVTVGEFMRRWSERFDAEELTTFLTDLIKYGVITLDAPAYGVADSVHSGGQRH